MATNSGRGDPTPAYFCSESESSTSSSEKSTSNQNQNQNHTPPSLPSDTKSAILTQEHDPSSVKHGGLGSTGSHDGGEDKSGTITKTSANTEHVPLPKEEPQPMGKDEDEDKE